MTVKALVPFTYRDPDTGDMISPACNSLVVVDDTLGAQFISDGYAEEYTLITPTGSVNITENGEVDVTQYATAVVNVS